jgi:peroxiredoxin
LRDDYQRFVDAGAEILAVAPHDVSECARHGAQAGLPFPILADPRRRVFARYDVRWALGSLGQRPGLYVIDRDGIVRYALLGAQQWEIPSNAEVLAALAALAGAHEPSEVAFPGDEGQRASE